MPKKLNDSAELATALKQLEMALSDEELKRSPSRYDLLKRLVGELKTLKPGEMPGATLAGLLQQFLAEQLSEEMADQQSKLSQATNVTSAQAHRAVLASLEEARAQVSLIDPKTTQPAIAAAAKTLQSLNAQAEAAVSEAKGLKLGPIAPVTLGRKPAKP